VELDGGQHYDGIQRLKDLARDEWLAKRGVRVLRFSDRDLLLEPDAVEETIWRAVSDAVSEIDTSASP
jgi:very-short-patch-repair endonuclease